MIPCARVGMQVSWTFDTDTSYFSNEKAGKELEKSRILKSPMISLLMCDILKGTTKESKCTLYALNELFGEK